MATDATPRISEVPRHTDAADDPSTVTTASEFYSLLDSVDSEAIGSDFELDRYSKRHDFTEHVTIANYEGLEDSDSLKSLDQKTDTHAGIDSISASHFSRLTNDRDYRAVVELLSEMLHTPQLYHQLGCERKPLERLEDQIVAIDATHLSLATTLVVPSECRDNDEPSELRPEDGGLKLHLAARVDGETKQPLSAVVTPPNRHETTQFDRLLADVEVADDLDSLILVFDRGYVDYDRYCALKRRGTDFVTPLRSTARIDVVERLHDIEVHDVAGTRRVTDDLVELGDTAKAFARVTVEDANGDITEYLTTLSAEQYDPVDMVNIYTLRWLIEILFRELKQYTNVQEFHSKSLNGVLFELVCTLIAYLLVEWFRHRHPLRGGVPDAIRLIRNTWDQPPPEYD
jgi:hypothetical protein